MFANGRGGPRDPQRAVGQFDAAAEKGHIGAMFVAGALLGGEHGISVSWEAAARWYAAAAASGGREAEAALAPSGEASSLTQAAGRSEESRPSTL